MKNSSQPEIAVNNFVKAVIDWNKSISDGDPIEISNEIGQRITQTFETIRTIGPSARDLL